MASVAGQAALRAGSWNQTRTVPPVISKLGSTSILTSYVPSLLRDAVAAKRHAVSSRSSSPAPWTQVAPWARDPTRRTG